MLYHISEVLNRVLSKLAIKHKFTPKKFKYVLFTRYEELASNVYESNPEFKLDIYEPRYDSTNLQVFKVRGIRDLSAVLELVNQKEGDCNIYRVEKDSHRLIFKRKGYLVSLVE